MIEANEATNNEVNVDVNTAAGVLDETNLSVDPGVATSTTDVPSDNNIITELKDVYKQIDNLNEQLEAAIKQRDQLLAHPDACGPVKQEINRLLGKLVPYTNCFTNFIQSLQNNLNNIEVSSKVEAEFFSNLSIFAENYEPTDDEVNKIVSNLGETIGARTGYSSLAILSSFNATIKGYSRSNVDLGNDHSRNIATIKPSRAVNVIS